MDLLILYSDSKKGVVLSLSKLLRDRGIAFHPVPLPAYWTAADSDELLRQLKSSTHWLFLVQGEDFSNPSFLFAAGYCLALHERSYLLDSGIAVPASWKGLLNVFQDFSALVHALDTERKQWFAHLERLEAQRKLTERGIEVSNTSYLEAVATGDQVSCELFLRAGFSPDLTNKKGVSVLCLAVRAAHLGVMRLLLDEGADVNLRSKDRDNSPLMDAAAEGLSDIVDELINRGADLTGQSRNGQNALVLAIGKGAQDIASALLEAGADPFVADKLGMNACQYAQLLNRSDFLVNVKAKFPGQI